MGNIQASFKRVQASLEGEGGYLESKRAEFPAFCFLSSQELLLLLGVREPLQALPFLPKLFPGERPPLP